MENKGYEEGDTCASWIRRNGTISYPKTPTNTRNIDEIWTTVRDMEKRGGWWEDVSRVSTISHPKQVWSSTQKDSKIAENIRKQSKPIENKRNIPKNN